MPSYSGIWSLSQQFQGRGQGLWPQVPGAPTIGTATAGTNLCASVTFTAPACAGVPSTITSYTVTSTPGSITASGAASPLTVTGLTLGTAYTFRVKATNLAGTGLCSAASNSITAALVTCATFTTVGTFTWVAPAGVTSVSAVAIGGGGSGRYGFSGPGGGGGGLGWRNTIAVTPGTSYTVVVGAGGSASGNGNNGGQSSVFTGLSGCGGIRGYDSRNGGSYAGSGGGVGGQGGGGSSSGGGGGGAGGYTGTGGNGGNGTSCSSPNPGGASSGGSGSGGAGGYRLSGSLYFTNGSGGEGASVYGSGGGSKVWGGGGGGGGYSECCCCIQFFDGCSGGRGAVRIVWAGGARGTPSFPSTNVGP